MGQKPVKKRAFLRYTGAILLVPLPFQLFPFCLLVYYIRAFEKMRQPFGSEEFWGLARLKRRSMPTAACD